MARKGNQTERIIINVTPEQKAAVKLALEQSMKLYENYRQRHPGLDLPYLSNNDELLGYLEQLCEANRVEWPKHVKQQGKRNDLKPNP